MEWRLLAVGCDCTMRVIADTLWRKGTFTAATIIFGGQMKVRINPDKCTGHGQCAANASEVFELDDLGYAIPFDTVVDPQSEEQARLGAAACPERAVEILD
jgi:ferredoxin